MTQPIVVRIPHEHGKDEAMRRLKAGLSSVRAQLSNLLTVEEEKWDGDTLHFRVSALRQQAVGAISVHEAYIVVTVALPWLLSRFAQAIQHAVKRQGTLLLENK